MPKAKKRLRFVESVGEITVEGGIPTITMVVDGKHRRYGFAFNTLVHLNALTIRQIDKSIGNTPSQIGGRHGQS